MQNRPFSAFALLLAIGLVTLAQPRAVAKNPTAAPAATYPASTPGAGPVRNEDWFVKVWHERRDLFAKEKTEQQHALVFLGDSITQGWSEDFRGRFKNTNLKLANRGLSGDITRGILARLDDDVLALDPQAVVLLIGTNDLDVGLSPEDIAGNVKLILDRLAAHNPKMPIILCKVMPSSATEKRSAESITDLNDRVADIARNFKQVTILDTYTLFANAKGDAKPEEFPDLLHPNDIGYDKWHNALVPLFATLGFIETDPDTFQPEPGFESLFNGHDLTGWGYRKTSDEERANIEHWRASDKKMPAYPIVETPVEFEGESASADGRFRAINGRLVAITPTEGRCVQQINTTRDFPNDFTLRLDFRATPNADSGVFIRGHQLQCRDYALAGPYKDLKNYKAQDWNELVITVKGNEAHCTCNGEVLEAALKVPDTGPIGVEGDRGQMEYRRFRLRHD
jgi:lysophospholipase L1-like esterase